MELTVDAGDVRLPATLDLPSGPVRGGLVVLHGAAMGERSYFLYTHLGRLLTGRGVAVLRYDRRPSADGRDIPYAVQAGDALAALRLLRSHVGPVPVGLYGYSQGAWVAPLLATGHPEQVDFLILVSASGVSPAVQMRYGTAEQLRRHGYGPDALTGLARLREALEEYQRGRLPRDRAQAVVDRYADQPWFAHAYVPRQLPAAPGSWTDMDFDPAPVFGAVRCPVLAYYGEVDEWVPVEESLAVWRAGGAAVTLVRLAGCDHLPTIGNRPDPAAVSPDYTAALTGWLDARL